MFHHTHAYAAIWITGESDPLVLYGSFFPDIPVTGIIKWDLMNKKSKSFSLWAKRNKKMRNFGVGVSVHEHPYGIDRFGHGKSKNGYAYKNSKKIFSELKKYLKNEKLARDFAHNFIEAGVEYSLLQDHPEMSTVVKNCVKNIDASKISRLFSKYFKLDYKKTKHAVEDYNNLVLDYDYSKINGITNSFLFMAERFMGKNFGFFKKIIMRRKINNLIRKSIEIVRPTWREFLDDSIAKCKRVFKK